MASSLSFSSLLLLLVLSMPCSSSSQPNPCSSQSFSKNRLFSLCASLPTLSASLHWTFSSSKSTLSLAFTAPPPSPAGWISWAINPSGTGMAGAQTIIAFRGPDGAMIAQTFNVTGYGPIKPSPIAFETWDLEAEEGNGVMRVFAKIRVPAGMRVVNQVWQVGAAVAGGVPQKHAFALENLAALGKLDLVQGGNVVEGGVNSALRKRNIHGVLNAVSWGILLPIGVIMARYLKTFSCADPAWFYLHVAFQLSGYGVGVAGWATGLDLGSKSKGVTYSLHRNIGIALFSLATLQIFALFLRPKKDHKYRFYWNIYHQSVGYTVIILGIINVFKGLVILNPPQHWKTAYISIIAILGGVSVVLEVVTLIVAFRRKSKKSSKLYDGSNGHQGVQQPLQVI